MTERNCTSQEGNKHTPLLELIELHRPRIAHHLTRYVVLPNGCWRWSGAKRRQSNGPDHGTISISKKIKVFAHRVAYAFYFGVDPGPNLVRHKCDYGLCVNPAHLELGTHEENMRDMVERKRAAVMQGDKNPRSKLSESDVLRIATLLPKLNNQQIATALDHKVSHSMVSRIRTGKAWNHLTKIAKPTKAA